MQNKVLSMLSLAAKAGKTASGEFAAEKAIKSRNAYLVIVAEDASDNTKKHFQDMCSYRNIPMYIYGIKNELGRSIGREDRACIALTDEGFGNCIKLRLKEDK